jgi:hypothetical protein
MSVISLICSQAYLMLAPNRVVFSFGLFHSGICRWLVQSRDSFQVVTRCILLAIANGKPLRRWELPNMRCRLPTSQRHRCFWYSHIYGHSDFLTHSVAHVSILALVEGSHLGYQPRSGMAAAIIINYLLLYR